MCVLANKYRVYSTVIVLISSAGITNCDAISNTSFNVSIRNFTANDDNNATHVKTLQKEVLGKQTNSVPTSNLIKFKEIPDSALSSSSHSRGLMFHDHPGYALNDYEEGNPHFGFGQDYHFQDARPHSDHHADPHSQHGYDAHDYDLHHYEPHHYGGHHHFDHGHYKHYKHPLATKAVLLPLAGIALLGAAAALVSNPVLLQLGVISGKRRRRDTEEITGPEFSTDMFQKYLTSIKKLNTEAKVKIDKSVNENFKRRILNTNNVKNENIKRRFLPTHTTIDSKRSIVLKGVRSSVKLPNEQSTYSPVRFDNKYEDDRFIPIPLQLRSPKNSDN